jgi:hypothetical protein
MRTQVITTRFPTGDAEKIKQHAELLNISVAEFTRLACKTFVECEEQILHLNKLQNEITKNVFVMLSASINLSMDERKQAARVINSELEGVSVK